MTETEIAAARRIFTIAARWRGTPRLEPGTEATTFRDAVESINWLLDDAVLRNAEKAVLHARLRAAEEERDNYRDACGGDASVNWKASYEQACADADRRVHDLETQIADGRCCDDFERLPKCGHPRCVVSETCEICVEIRRIAETVGDEIQKRIARSVEIGFCGHGQVDAIAAAIRGMRFDVVLDGLVNFIIP